MVFSIISWRNYLVCLGVETLINHPMPIVDAACEGSVYCTNIGDIRNYIILHNLNSK